MWGSNWNRRWLKFYFLHLDTFYSQALAKYTNADFVAAGYTGVYALLQQVASDEANHVAFLTSALTAAGAVPVSVSHIFLIDSALRNIVSTSFDFFLGL